MRLRVDARGSLYIDGGRVRCTPARSLPRPAPPSRHGASFLCHPLAVRRSGRCQRDCGRPPCVPLRPGQRVSKTNRTRGQATQGSSRRGAHEARRCARGSKARGAAERRGGGRQSQRGSEEREGEKKRERGKYKKKVSLSRFASSASFAVEGVYAGDAAECARTLCLIESVAWATQSGGHLLRCVS